MLSSKRVIAVARLLVLLTLVGAALASPRAVHATVSYRHVVADVGAAGGACDTWASACTLHYALMIAQPGDEVWVKAGVYGPTSIYNPSRYDTFAVPAGVRVYGGFGGHETARGQRNPGTHITILTGDIDGNDVNTDGNYIDETALDHRGGNSYTVVTIDGTNTPVTSSTVLDGFTITGGHGEGGPRTGGGGLYCNGRGAGSECSPHLNNLTFSGNSSYNGGAIQNDGLLGKSSPALTNMTFQGNRAHFGGALDNNGYEGISDPTLINVTFYGNWVENCCGNAFGGAIENRGSLGRSSPTLTNVTFYGNGAQNGGGAVYSNGHQGYSNAYLSNVILWNDLSPASPEVLNYDATANISRSDIDGGCASIALATCSGNINADPLLLPLGKYGGSTMTMPLSIDSPAVDAGTNTACPSSDARAIARPADGDADGTAVCDMGATESRRMSSTLQSAAAYDGWVLESGETTGVGGSLDSTATTFNLGDDAANRQYRSFLSFNTATLPDYAAVTAATVKMLKFALTGSSPFATLGNIVVDVRTGSFASNPSLQLADFNAWATITAATWISNNPVSGWYSQSIPAMWLPLINKAGPTQLRLRFATDDNNNHIADYLQFYSANAASANRPVLIVKYYAP